MVLIDRKNAKWYSTIKRSRISGMERSVDKERQPIKRYVEENILFSFA